MHKPAAPFRRQLLLGGLASALTLVAGCSKFARPHGKTLAKEATLLCLGDSLTFGYGAAAGTSCQRRSTASSETCAPPGTFADGASACGVSRASSSSWLRSRRRRSR